jgi:N-acylglucosamine 2-epimerase
LAKATGREEPAALARKTADNAIRRLQAPHDRIPHRPYPVPRGTRVHGLPMIFSLVLWELGQLLDERRYRQAALAMSEDVVSNFYRPDRDMLLERVASDNSEYPAPEGTTIVPGHVIEGMWFRIHIARDMKHHQQIAQACRLIRRHAELGWDNDFGGLFHAIDADGRADAAWPFPDCKIWWTHTEALYALLLAYECTGEPWCLEWYGRVHEYSFRVFPVEGHGEWTQRLDRRGRSISDTVCLPVKDPFHLPRALIYCIEVLDRLIRH